MEALILQFLIEIFLLKNMNFFYFFTIQYIRRGYIALLSVIALGAIGVAIMMGVILSAVNSTKTNIQVSQGSNARLVATACQEEALQTILETGTTSKTASLTIASGTCQYTISTSSGQTITIVATGTVGTLTSKIKVIVGTTSPSLILSSWQDVSDF